MDVYGARRDMIAFRTANSRNPVLSHRASTAVCQMEHLQCPADASHERRLRQGLNRTAREIAQARRTSGRYAPSHQRPRPFNTRR
jgi:hypothetical protein